MNKILVFDLETTGLDPADSEIIEVGWAIWSLEWRALISCHSFLVGAESNAAEPFNGISVELLVTCGGGSEVGWALLAAELDDVSVVVGHYCDFDRRFIVHRAPSDIASLMVSKQWVCTREDFEWPRMTRDSLVALALENNVSAVAAHRSIHDVLLITRLLEAVPDSVARFWEAWRRASRPKDTFVSLEPYEMKDIVKANGFKWDGSSWKRRMAIEDAEKLPFRVARLSECLP